MSQVPFFIVQVDPLSRADRTRLVECERQRNFPRVNAGLIRITEHGPVVWVGAQKMREAERFLLQESGFSRQFSQSLDKAYDQARRFAYVLLDEYDSLEEALSGLSYYSPSANRLPV